MTWLFIPVFVLIVMLAVVCYMLHESIQRLDQGRPAKPPRFIPGDTKLCAKHNGPAGEYPAEAQVVIPLGGDLEIPVTIYICQSCQRAA